MSGHRCSGSQQLVAKHLDLFSLCRERDIEIDDAGGKILGSSAQFCRYSHENKMLKS